MRRTRLLPVSSGGPLACTPVLRIRVGPSFLVPGWHIMSAGAAEIFANSLRPDTAALALFRLFGYTSRHGYRPRHLLRPFRECRADRLLARLRRAALGRAAGRTGRAAGADQRAPDGSRGHP